MGFFSRLGQAISDAADSAASAVADAANAVGDAVGGAIESAGNAIADAAEAAADWLGRLPGVGPVLAAVLNWAAAGISATLQFAATALRAVLNIAGNVVAGAIRIVGGAIGGIFSGDLRLVVKGLGDIGASLAGGVVATAATLIALVQTVLVLQRRDRPLTPFEEEMLRRVFRKSVDLRKVRIVEGFAGLFSLSARPFTMGNRIYMKGDRLPERIDVLVHECGHVWQNQHEGTRYIGGALWAQATYDNAYDWKAEIDAGKKHWREFNKEAQAAFLETVFRNGKLVPETDGWGQFYADEPLGANVSFQWGADDLSGFARDTVAYVRSA